MSSRHNTKLSIHSKAIVCQDTDIRGEVTIGPGTVVHPKVMIVASSGPIVIGSGNILEEGTVLVNRRPGIMRVGNDNLFEISTRIECPSIGDCNTFHVRSRVHHTVQVSSHCVIGALCLVAPTEDEVLDDYTVVFGPDAERRTWSGRGETQELDLRKKHFEYLKEMLPKFNRLRKPDASASRSTNE